MSEALQEPVASAQTISAEVHSDLSGYDGSRTPPDVQFEILRLHKRWGHSPHAIGQILGMDARTVKAVIAREADEGQDAVNYLKSHRLHIAQKLVRAIETGAEKGKGEAAIQTLDRLGVTEPPKSGAQTSVGVQVILNGGAAPSELSRAKVEETSEGLENQAGIPLRPITQLMVTAELPQHQSLSVTGSPIVAQDAPAAALLQTESTQGATFVAESGKQA